MCVTKFIYKNTFNRTRAVKLLKYFFAISCVLKKKLVTINCDFKIAQLKTQNYENYAGTLYG